MKTPDERLTAIETNIASMRTTLADIAKRLFGNGHPGVIDSFEVRLRRAEVGLVVALILAGGLKIIELWKP